MSTMQLTPNEEQQAFVAELRRLLVDRDALGRARAAMATDHGFDRALWAELGALGVPSMAVAEADGGAGFGFVDLLLAIETLAAALSVGPLAASAAMAAPLLASCDNADFAGEWLPKLASGDAIGAVAFDAGLHDCAAADLLIVATANGVFALEGPELAALPAMDMSRGLVRLSARELRLSRATRLMGPQRAAEVLPRIEALGRCALAAECVGLAAKALELAVAYGKTRVQFGRPIGSFQAYKHRCADMMVLVENARSAARAAAWSADHDPDRLLDRAAIAARVCADNAFTVAAECIQLHGGIGFCWEHDAHLLFKRAHAAKALAGPIAVALPEAIITGADDQPSPLVAEINAWLDANLVGEFEALRGRGGPGDEIIELLALRRKWEQRLAKGRWNCLSWPQEHGGLGLSVADQVAVNEAYARAGGPGRLGHIGETLLGPTLIEHGTAAQKARFLPAIRSAEALWCQGYSEPDAGSDLANVRTRAVLDGDVWRITGQKVWTSHAAWSQWCFAICRVDPESSRHRGLAYLLVPMDQAGISPRPIEQMTGPGEFFEVFFDGAVTAADNIVGAVGDGWKIAMSTLMHERGASTLAQQIGFARELEAILAGARENGAIDDPLIRARLEKARAGLEVMRAGALRTLDDVQRGELGRTAVINKLSWSHWHRDLGELAVDVLGPEALLLDAAPYELSAAQRLFLFSRADTIYAGTSEIQRNIISERALGLPRGPR